jgi:cation diffusion facilitator CzcD-associated flavoprotein CzcO
MARAHEPQIVIVGGGFGGVAAAIELQRHGFRNLTILERSEEIGGTWFHNSYPGAACDVPSHLYSFSFAQRRDWSRLCSPQAEILEYLRAVAHEHGLEQITTTNTEIGRCEWDEQTLKWTLESSDGRHFAADAVVLATGQLHQPAYPQIEGSEKFTGHSFHSASWDHDYEFSARSVAVIGSGASAVQFIPEIVESLDKLTVFQRTGNWFLPRKNSAYPPLARAIIARIPGVQAFRRKFIFYYGELLTFMIRHPRSAGLIGRMRSTLFMRSQLKDPRLREQVWPRYTFGCKRVLFSSYYLQALEREHVEVCTEAIARMTERGIVTVSGAEHDLDCVIYATGFATNDFMFPMEIVGAGGVSLREQWADGPHAHLGVTVPGFPSLFLMYGPNTNTSGGSIIVFLEAQAAYIRQALAQIRDRGARAIDVKATVEAASDQRTQQRFAGTAWVRCDSWYRDQQGRILANWPGYMREYLNATRRLEPQEYSFISSPRPQQLPAGVEPPAAVA